MTVMVCRRYAAYTMLAGDTSANSPEIHCSNTLGRQAMMQVDLALMSGCPYPLAEPVLEYSCALLQRSVSGMNTHKSRTLTSQLKRIKTVGITHHCFPFLHKLKSVLCRLSSR